MRVNTLISIVLLSILPVLNGVSLAADRAYVQHNLVSDLPGEADLQDTSLVNAWGLAAGPLTPWWVANNKTGTSTLYNGTTGAKLSLEVNVPGSPTGLVFNGGSGFVVTDGVDSGAALFIFASEDGTISGWSPGVPPPAPSHQAMVAVPIDPARPAIYKGLAIASRPGGDFLYATNFLAATVDVFDSSFKLVQTFTDPDLPEGYAPFGIQNLDGFIYVTYALQDEDKEDDVAGHGHGFVDKFDTAGQFLQRVASRGRLNSPWGLALAPADFGEFSNHLLVGNFGDGRIHAFDPNHLNGKGEFQDRGALHGVHGGPIRIDGLWALAFSNGASTGPPGTLFFTAGPSDEEHGLFGSLVPAPPHGHAPPPHGHH